VHMSKGFLHLSLVYSTYLHVRIYLHIGNYAMSVLGVCVTAESRGRQGDHEAWSRENVSHPFVSGLLHGQGDSGNHWEINSPCMYAHVHVCVFVCGICWCLLSDFESNLTRVLTQMEAWVCKQHGNKTIRHNHR